MGMEFRPYYLAKEWIKQGHRVCIVGGSYSHLRKLQPEVLNDSKIEEIDGIRYYWLKTPGYTSSGVKRFWSMIVFVMKLFKYKKRLVEFIHPTVVIASSTYPIDVYPAHSIAKKAKAKLCFELHDLWPLSPMEIGGYSKWHPFILLMQAGENYACRHSDVIVSLLENAKQHLVSHGMRPNKFHHIINGFSMDKLKNANKQLPQELEQMLEQLKIQGKFIIGYAGGMNPSNAMKTWVKAAMSLNGNKRICFVTVGTGSELNELKIYTSENALDYIYFYPAIDKDSISRFLEYCDVLYVGFVHSCLHQYGIAANKITDYMLAAKPIILSADVESGVVTKVGCGLTVPAEDSKALKDAIVEIADMDQSERDQMGQNGKEYALRELNYDVLSRKFIQALNGIDMIDNTEKQEIELIRERYAKRSNHAKQTAKCFYAGLYTVKEREIQYACIIRENLGHDLSTKRIIEIGAGSGSNLLFYQNLGFKWENIYANELLEERYRALCERLPHSTCILGDALKLEYKNEFDIVFQSTVFTSILNQEFRKNLAHKMVEMLKPGGIIISYDFTWNNPQNKDVRKLTKKDIRSLFSQCNEIQFKRVTLAPPVSRRVGRWYDIVNFLFPFLRTHTIAIIKKLV
jgi:glycosyltransferase involved in cell wall biosynthesis/SAM-dependent methyltransferase